MLPLTALKLPLPLGAVFVMQSTAREREIMLAIIKEHPGHLTHSVSRIQSLAKKREESLGISVPELTPHPLLDLPWDQPDVSA